MSIEKAVRQTIYVVEQGDYSDYGVCCAFVDEDDARAAVAAGVGDGYREMALLPAGDLPRKRVVYHAHARLWLHGGTAEDPTVWPMEGWDFDDEPAARRVVIEEGLWPVEAPRQWNVRARSISRERALKACADRIAKKRAELNEPSPEIGGPAS